MQTIQKVTTEFVESEDRFSLSVESQIGSNLIFWLTQRLLARIVRHCIDWLDKKSPEMPQAVSGARGSIGVQNLVQHSAQQKLSKVEAVRTDKNSRGFLVEQVDFTAGEKGITLTFNEEGSTYVLNLDAEQLRQWLGIVFALWRRAEWPDSVWPTWVGTSNDIGVSKTSSIH